MQQLFTQFTEHCNEKGLRSNTALLLSYMLEQKLVSDTIMRQYVVLQTFRKLRSAPNPPTKTALVRKLAVMFELHENTVWNLLKDHAGKW
ncbi:MAG: hypothetical protein R3B47_14460 [Bacteroidia bacterium]